MADTKVDVGDAVESASPNSQEIHHGTNPVFPYPQGPRTDDY